MTEVYLIPRTTQVLPWGVELDQDEVLGGDNVQEVVPRQHQHIVLLQDVHIATEALHHRDFCVW